MSIHADHPAFPISSTSEPFEAGLTVRQYFAAIAMQGILAASAEQHPSQTAKVAIANADALIKALNHTQAGVE